MLVKPKTKNKMKSVPSKNTTSAAVPQKQEGVLPPSAHLTQMMTTWDNMWKTKDKKKEMKMI